MAAKLAADARLRMMPKQVWDNYGLNRLIEKCSVGLSLGTNKVDEREI